MIEIPNIDLRESKGELPFPVKAPRKKLTATQWAAIVLWIILAICIAPVIFVTLWAFGPLMGAGILIVCVFKAL